MFMTDYYEFMTLFPYIPNIKNFMIVYHQISISTAYKLSIQDIITQIAILK